ncbi:regulator of chromosome condensation 1/beta-lactamase-inhibitor protein II [Pelagophyceae sp. CCMP2097]|nr:regulator of chromosome condensation 1/beta-lactamase-inhibitor protein II [Pelagophyceae sp. CCMP2097]
MCGSNDWATVVKGGKAKPKGAVAGGDEFNSPVRMRSCLDNVRVKSLGVGPCAAHCVALTADGRVFVWGLNTSGQLGLGNGSPEVVPGPTLALLWKSHTLKAACGKTAAIKAACGKTHTLIVFEDGAMLSCGAGAKGALGYGTRKADLKEISPTPKRVLAGQVSENTHFVDAAAGCDFSLGVTADGQLYSWGWTEFGKLGLGDDGCYNTKAASIKLTYTASGAPARVRLPRDDSPEAKIVSAAAGKNHAACVCADGQGYTWGDGAYGKLGHRAQEQGVRPRLLDQVRFSVLYCGDMSTCGLGWPEYRGREFAKPANDGMLYAWGVLKGTHGEGATRPVPEYELQGWSVKPEALSMGASHVSLSADGTAIAWAQTCVASGQLGYGDKGPKSSNKPQKLSDLDGAAVCQVVAAAGTTFFLADAKCPKVKALPEYTPPEASAPPLDEDADPAAAKKGAKPGAKPAAKRAAPKAKAEPKAKAPAKRAKK